MTRTGLTDVEKESLLKFFLTHCEVRYDEGRNVHELRFFNSPEVIHPDTAGTIVKAMTNLRNSIFMRG